MVAKLSERKMITVSNERVNRQISPQNYNRQIKMVPPLTSAAGGYDMAH